MASGLVHFEIHVNDTQRAMKFYGDLFGWSFEKADVGMEYWLIRTGRTLDRVGEKIGIDGGLMARNSAEGPEGASPNAFVCTVQVDNIDETIELAIASGAKTQVEKNNLPGVGWLCYFKDSEGNIFGVLQPEMSQA